MKITKKIVSVILSIALLFSCAAVSFAATETQFQYYCGFESYAEQVSGISYDSAVAQITTEDFYKGASSMKLTLDKGGITAFELRDDTAFNIVSGKEYKVDFAYKASADTELNVGLAKSGNITGSAVSCASLNGAASDEWQTASLTFTADKSTNDGYALAMLVFAENGAEVYIDDVVITYYSEGASALEEIDFGFSASDSLPALKVFTEPKDTGSEEDTPMVTEPTVWDGTVAEAFAGGTGTEADPYLIATAEQLALAVTQSGTTTQTVTAEDGTETTETVNEAYYGSYYKLTSDILLNEKDAIDWKNASSKQSGLNSWYGASQNFAGTIDGDGHTVYGLYYYVGGTIQYSLGSGRSGSALIPQAVAENAVVISNLGIDNSFLRDRYTAAAFVANGGAKITNCYVGANVHIVGRDIGAFIGRSYANDFTLRNCYSLATVYGNTYSAYGLVGQVYQSDVRVYNCYNANGPIASYSNGNYSTWYKFYNSYETVQSGNATYDDAHQVKTNVVLIEDVANMQGTDALSNEAKMPYLALNTDGTANTAYTATSGYPVLSLWAPEPEVEEGEEEEEIVYDIWDGTKTAPKDSDGDGVYEITNGAELAYIIVNHGTMITGTETTTDEETGEEVTTNVTAEACSFILTNDIYLNDITKINWLTGDVAIGYTVNRWFGNANYFAGTIDGNGYTVHGILHDANALDAKGWKIYGVGLVPRVLHGDTCTIRNLGVDHTYINYDGGVSAFVGCAGTNNSNPTDKAEVIIEQCYAGENVMLIGHSVGVFRGAGRGSNTYIRNCYSLASVDAVGDYGLASHGWDASVAFEGSFNANGPLVTATNSTITSSNSYQTQAGKFSTVTDITNMKGADVLTNSAKMPKLDSSVFTATDKTFAEHDFYVYLPQGTTFTEKVKAEFYNDFFIKLDKSATVVDGVMQKGAYVKFVEEPDESKITVPAEYKEFVCFGSKAELELANPYYGVKMDFITNELAKDSDSVKYAFITDIHYVGSEDVPRTISTVKQIENLVEYVNKTDEIDFVAVGGDTIQGTQKKSTSLNYFKKAFTPFLECNKPVVIVPGNHDDNSYAYNTKTFDGSWVITDKEWNDNIIDVYVNRSTADGDLIDVSVSQDNSVENSKYFYYDLENKKTRIICLDAIDYEQTYDENGTLTVDADGNVGLSIRDDSKAVTNYYRYYMATTYWGYGARQMEWLAEEAMQAGDDWNYIFISHMGIDEDTNFNEGANITWYGKNLREIIGAYQLKTAYTNEELGISVDFSDTKGEILAYQFGHIHKQKSLYSADVDLWQIYTGSAQVRDGLFDIMTVNSTEINRYAIGRGYDERFVQTKDVIAGDLTSDASVDICDLVHLNNISEGVTLKASSADVDGNRTLEIGDSTLLRTMLIS